MFITSRRHKRETSRLSAELESKDRRLDQVEARAAEAERSRHELIEEFRYVLQSGSIAISAIDRPRSERLEMLAHLLPYLLSGRRHWDEPELPNLADDARQRASQLAERYGFELPADPVVATKALLDVAMVLFNPAASTPIEGLQNLFPLTRERMDALRKEAMAEVREIAKAALFADNTDITPCAHEEAIRRINAKQPRPAPNNNPAVWDLVVADMHARDAMGARKHGTRLLAHNGRDVFVDAYQEALDLVVYLRQAIYERDGQ